MLITRLWKNQPGKYFCISSKSASGVWRDKMFKRDELRKVPAYIENNSDKDLYFCPHGFNEPRRHKSCVALPRLLWSDMDEVDPRKAKIKPTIALESSPGRFVGLWIVDKKIEESTNRRLTYLLGSDVSGWDLTQVLRIPGTLNYKYSSKPKVRTLWNDGPEYSLREIEKQLPKEDESTGVNENDASKVFKKYEKKMPAWCRRELLGGKPAPGKRSEMLWKLEQTLVECGLTRDESFILLKSSPWNKFRGRRNEDEQLQRELDKALNRHFKAAPAREEDYKYLQELMEQVEEENIDWIWYPYLARGELSILEGDPGLGKSYVAQMVGKSIVDKEILPSVKKMPAVSGKVAFFDLENSRGSVTKPRLIDNGCKNLSKFYQDEQPFSIDNAERLEGVYDAIENLRPVLVVFDTLNTYIGSADIHKSSESQQAMATFRDIAVRFNCSVLVLRHLTKGSKDKALYRGQGSIAFAGLARVVMTIGSMPDDPETKVMAVTKINVTKAPRALSFTINRLPDTLKRQDRSKFEWGDFVDVSSDDILGAPTGGDGGKGEAIEFLKGVLDEEDVEFHRLEKMAETRSISLRTLHRAADELGVEKKVKGFGKEKRSIWSWDGESGASRER